MSTVEKLEEKYYEQQVIIGRLEGEIKGRLLSIETLLINLSTVKEAITISEQKHITSTEAIKDIQKTIKKIDTQINGINAKIAMISGGWAVVMYVISKF